MAKSNILLQKQELENLLFIYEPNQLKFKLSELKSSYSGKFLAYPRLDSYHARIRGIFFNPWMLQPPSQDCDALNVREFILEYLPPIICNFELTPDYPTLSKPIFKLYCSWLSQIAFDQLQKKMDNFLETLEIKDIDLWTLFEYLETGIMKNDCFQINTTKKEYIFDLFALYENESSHSTQVEIQNVTNTLLRFNIRRFKQLFKQSVMDCCICGESAMMNKFTKFLVCKHIFCHNCLSESLKYFMQQTVYKKHFTCLACSEPISINEIKEFASADLLANYDALLLKRSLAVMHDIANCPRNTCQRTVWLENEDLGICETCNYCFCPKCLHAYHPNEFCSKAISNLQESDDDEDIPPYNLITWNEQNNEVDFLLFATTVNLKLRLKMMETLTNSLQSDKILVIPESIASDNGLGIQKCPHCPIYIQRISGCNHMKCTECENQFTWKENIT